MMKNKKIYIAREIIKWGILIGVVFLALIHVFGNKAVWAPLDAYCPFGSLESGWKLITQGGFIEKIQPSNLALLIALFVTTLLFGGVFCGWICPLGTLQDGLNKLGRKLKLPQIKLTAKLDKYLRWLRLPYLILVLFESYLLVRLWFADYDPFRLLFGFHWLSEPDKILLGGWIVIVLFPVLSLVWSRFWCKYLCPFGLVVQWLSKISWFRIRWSKPECTQCNICSKSCPMGIEVRDPKLNSTQCNDCLECVSVCPQPKALGYQMKFANGSTLAVIGVAVFGVVLAVAQIIGFWNPKIGSDPASIKGWMTLGYLSETYHIPLDEIKKEMQLPATADAKTEIRSFESVIPNFSTDLFRVYIAKRIGVPYTGSSESMEKESKPAGGENLQPVKSAEPSAKPQITPMTSGKVQTTPAPSHQPKPSTAVAPDEIRNPDDIKGSMTLKEVSDGWKIPLATLVEKLGLPKNVDTNVPIKEYDTPYGVGGAKVREVVKAILGK